MTDAGNVTASEDGRVDSITRLSQWFSKAAWGLKGVMGGHAYERYVSHFRQEHPGEEPLTEREFWKQKATDDEKSVQARCC